MAGEVHSRHATRGRAAGGVDARPHARDEAPGLALVAGGGADSRGRSQDVAQRGRLE
jgi:hypothetical protein